MTRVVIAQVAGDDATFILDCTIRLAEGNLAFYGAESFSSFADGVTYRWWAAAAAIRGPAAW